MSNERCLLFWFQVVMCGAVPSPVRSVSLYSTCNRGNVSVFGRKVNSTMVGETTAPYRKYLHPKKKKNHQTAFHVRKSISPTN